MNNPKYSSYGTNWREFEDLTGLHEGSKVAFYREGDKELRVGILVYHQVGAGFHLISLMDVISGEGYSVHNETNGHKKAFNCIEWERINILVNRKRYGPKLSTPKPRSFEWLYSWFWCNLDNLNK